MAVLFNSETHSSPDAGRVPARARVMLFYFPPTRLRWCGIGAVESKVLSAQASVTMHATSKWRTSAPSNDGGILQTQHRLFHSSPARLAPSKAHGIAAVRCEQYLFRSFTDMLPL